MDIDVDNKILLIEKVCRESLFNKLTQVHNKYEINKKEEHKSCGLFLKKDTFQHVLMKYNITELLNDTVYILPKQNILFIDYQVFKLFMTKDLYPLVIKQFINMLNLLLSVYPTFEVHVNLKGLTISSLQKYSGIFSLFYETCNHENIVFSKYITKCCLYNISNSIDAISKIIKQFVDDSVKKTVIFYNEKLISLI
jgi:hypothetical protein